MSNRRAAVALERSEIAGNWLAVPITRYGRSRLVIADRTVAVGDAAAFIDPFTGSGILLALQGAAIAAETLLDSYFTAGQDFAKFAGEYEARYAAGLRDRLRICSMLRLLTRSPWMADAMITLLSTSQLLRRQLARATRAAG